MRDVSDAAPARAGAYGVERRGIGAAAALLVLCLTSAVPPLSAHEVPIEPVVAMQLRPAGDRLDVDVQMPIAGLADANLPRGDNRRLARPDVDAVLSIAGRELASSLAIAQDDQPLSPPAISSTIAADEQSVAFHLQYRWQPGGGPLSARLHTVSARPRPLRMTAQFFAVDDTPRTFSVGGEPERVVFEPGPLAVATHFAEQAMRVLLRGGISVLALLCLVAPARTPRDLRLAVVALLGGGAVGILLGAGSLNPSVAGPAQAATLALAASCVVVLAVVNVADEQSIVARAIAALAGLTGGFALGDGLREQAAFAGSHAAIASVVFTAGVSIGLVWIATLLSFALDLLRQRGLPVRVGSIALSAYAAHTALHLFRDQANVLGDQPWWALTHVSELVVAGWLALALTIAIARLLRGAARFPVEWRPS